MRYTILALLVLLSVNIIAADKEEKKKVRRGLFGSRAKHEYRRDTTVHTVVVRDTVFIERGYDVIPAFMSDVNDDIPEEFEIRLDYLHNLWFLSRTLEGDIISDNYFKENPPIEFPDSVYLQRMDDLKSAIPLSYNEIVKRYIELYTKRGRVQTSKMLGLSKYYFPIFEEALDRHGLPLELKYLPVIESALNPTALSKAGACGLWQFMYSTGRMYKLDINSYIDERRDPLKATDAAVSYLKDLYGMYNNWMLVIAAYNCGPGNVNKAIRRSGGYKNYWDVYYHLPKETRGYIPAFIGAMYAFEYHKEHNILPTECDLPLLCDTLEINDLLHFEQVAHKLNIPMEQLRSLNPQYRADAIPGGADKSYILHLPYNYVGDFIDNQDTIFAFNKTKYFDLSDRKADPGNRIKVHAKPIGGGGDRIVYTVKSGDVPGAIATKFKVRLSDLRYWNNLNKKLTIRPGQKLVIYANKSVAAAHKNKTTSNTSAKSNATIEFEELKSGDYVYYTVKVGDNLWQIAKKYPGVSDRDIMRWNGISQNNLRDIKPGIKLKIKKVVG